MAHTRSALVAACLLALVVGALAQPMLVSTPVPGKLGYKPSANFCEAIVVPAQSTAYLSGQVGGNGTDFSAQVKRVMDGLNATLTGLGSTMDAVVKTTVYLLSIDTQFQPMNAVYRTYFTNGTLPARSTVAVSQLAGNTSVEIDFIAVDPVFATMKASS